MTKKLFGGGGSSNTQNNVSGYAALPTELQNYFKDIAAQGSNIASNATDYFSPQGINSYEQTASGMMQPENFGASVSQYLNPFRDMITQDINKQYEGGFGALKQRADEAGAFGSSRYREGQYNLIGTFYTDGEGDNIFYSRKVKLTITDKQLKFVEWLEKLPPAPVQEDKKDAIDFNQWLAEEGYEFTEVRNKMYLGGKYYYVWDLYSKYKPNAKNTFVQEDEQDEVMVDFLLDFAMVRPQLTTRAEVFNFIKNQKSKYTIIKKH